MDGFIPQKKWICIYIYLFIESYHCICVLILQIHTCLLHILTHSLHYLLVQHTTICALILHRLKYLIHSLSYFLYYSYYLAVNEKQRRHILFKAAQNGRRLRGCTCGTCVLFFCLDFFSFFLFPFDFFKKIFLIQKNHFPGKKLGEKIILQ